MRRCGKHVQLKIRNVLNGVFRLVSAVRRCKKTPEHLKSRKCPPLIPSRQYLFYVYGSDVILTISSWYGMKDIIRPYVPMFQAAIRQHLPCDKQPANLAILCPRKHRWFYPKMARKTQFKLTHPQITVSLDLAFSPQWALYFGMLHFRSSPQWSCFLLSNFTTDRWLGLSHAQPPARHFFSAADGREDSVLPMERFTRPHQGSCGPLVHMVCLYTKDGVKTGYPLVNIHSLRT